MLLSILALAAALAGTGIVGWVLLEEISRFESGRLDEGWALPQDCPEVGPASNPSRAGSGR